MTTPITEDAVAARRERISDDKLQEDLSRTEYLGDAYRALVILQAGYIGDLRDARAQCDADKATIVVMQKASKTIRRDAFNEIASIAEALASQQGIKSELAAALRERMSNED